MARASLDLAARPSAGAVVLRLPTTTPSWPRSPRLLALRPPDVARSATDGLDDGVTNWLSPPDQPVGHQESGSEHDHQ